MEVQVVLRGGRGSGVGTARRPRDTVLARSPFPPGLCEPAHLKPGRYEGRLISYRVVSTRVVYHVKPGGIYHVNDGYYYLRHSVDFNKIFVRCAMRKSCGARGSLPLCAQDRTVDKFVRSKPHNHAPDFTYLGVLSLRKAMLRRSREETTDYKTIFNEECNSAGIYHVNDGYYYLRDSTACNKIFLRCAIRKSCGARGSMPLCVEERTVETFIRTKPHDHGPDFTYLGLAALRKAIIRRSREETTTDYKTIFDEECSRYHIFNRIL
ncbi:hypothetical protein J6590_008745 [Homalodisca vitripennis]|nr:hypothetical protein J6590_008745 [Homalodisca vitripennis]